MYSVSTKYKEAMNAKIRNVGYVTVSVGVVSQEAQNSAEYENKGSYWSDAESSFKNKDVTDGYATLEQNLFKADGSMKFIPEKGSEEVLHLYRPFVTQDILGVVRINFNNSYDIKGLTIDFTENYPTEFKVVTDSKTLVYTNDRELFQTTDNLGNTSHVTLVPISMVGGKQRLRIAKITMGVGVVYTNDDINSLNFQEEVSFISEEVSSIDFSLTILDPENKYNVEDENSFINFLETGQNVSITTGLELDDGTVEYVPLGKLLLTNWKSTKNKMQFSAKSIFSFMNDKYSGGNYIHERTLYSDAVDVLTDYGLEPDQYVIDDCLNDVTVVNPLPEATHAELLQLIANASRCVCYQSKSGKIVFKANFATVIEPDDIKVESNTQSDWSTPHMVTTGSDYVYADLTNNFFSADGSMYFLPENSSSEYLPASFVSAEISNKDGEFLINPNLTIKLPAGYVYYGLSLLFDGNAPKEFLIKTSFNGVEQEVITVSDGISNKTYLSHEFKKFDTLRLEFTKASPKDRVLVNRVVFGELTDYTLSKDNMLEEPIGYRETRTKNVSVRICTFDGSGDTPQMVDDKVYYTKNINSVGENVVFENQLISTEEHAERVCEWLANYYSDNTSYTVKYRGEPRLNANDIIYLENSVVNNLQCEIEKNTFTFNGAFGGSLEMRKALYAEG